MIKEITAKTLGKNKLGWRFDRKRQLFVTFQADATFNGVRHVRRGFPSEKAAKEYLEQLQTQQRLVKLGIALPVTYPTVKQLFEIHFETIESKKSRGVAKRVFNQFYSQLPRGLRINELRRKHFKDFIELRISEGVKADTANREMTFISSALHKAGDYYAELETWQVPKIYRPQVSDEGRERVITRDEREKLLNYLLSERRDDEREKDFTARRRTGLVFYFGLLTGLRHGEICALRKSNLDRINRSLKAERFKTKKKGISQTIFEPLTDSQIWVLSEAEKLYPRGEFFFSARGLPHNKIYSILESACKVLKILYGKNTENGFVFHDTRHTFVTVLEHGAVDSSTTRSFSGHSKDSMMKRYSHATVESKARAMAIIESEIGGGQDLETIG